MRAWTAAALRAAAGEGQEKGKRELVEQQLPETPQPPSSPAASAPAPMEEEEGEEEGGGGRRGRGRRASRKRKRAKSQAEPEPEPVVASSSSAVVAVSVGEEEGLVRLRALVAEARALARRLGALFEWADGPLVEAMRDGHMLLLDEVREKE